MKHYRQFLLSMIKVGCIGFGGGNAMVPVIEKEIIEKQQLDTKFNYDKDVTVANITPGSLTVKLAASLGRRSFGSKGMVAGAVAMALPGCLVALLLFMALSIVKERMIGAIQIASVGAAAFIIYLLCDYILKVLDSCRKRAEVQGTAGNGQCICTGMR